MKKTLFAMVLAGLCLAQSSQAVTINTSFGILRNSSNTPMPDGGLLLLIASDNATFGAPSTSSFTTEADDVIVLKWGLNSAGSGAPGSDENNFSGLTLGATLPFGGSIQGGELLQLVWFPGLTTAASAPGFGAEFGTFRSDSPALGDPWVVPGDNGGQIDLSLNTDSYFGGPSPDSVGVAGFSTEILIPEPTTGLLTLMALGGLGSMLRRRK